MYFKSMFTGIMLSIYHNDACKPVKLRRIISDRESFPCKSVTYSLL